MAVALLGPLTVPMTAFCCPGPAPTPLASDSRPSPDPPAPAGLAPPSAPCPHCGGPSQHSACHQLASSRKEARHLPPPARGSGGPKWPSGGAFLYKAARSQSSRLGRWETEVPRAGSDQVNQTACFRAWSTLGQALSRAKAEGQGASLPSWAPLSSRLLCPSLPHGGPLPVKPRLFLATPNQACPDGR